MSVFIFYALNSTYLIFEIFFNTICRNNLAVLQSNVNIGALFIYPPPAPHPKSTSMNILHISSQKGDNDVRAYFWVCAEGKSDYQL